MEILNFKGPLSDLIYILKKGGSIHIKKKNRGKFTEYCGGKVTEECIAKGKKSKDPKIRKRATFAANARKWKHENGGIVSKYKDGEKFINPNYWDNSYFEINTFNDGNKSKEEELYEKTVPEIPYRPIDYSYYPQWNVFAHGLKNINQEIEDSSVDLYSDKNATYYKDKDNNYYVFNHTGDSGVINPENFKEVPYSEIRGKLAPRDYIGGDKRDVGIKVIEKIPNLKETISKLSDLYNISKDVFTQRLINEGWLQQIASNYNSAGPNEQKNFDWNSIMNDPVYGQSQLGLDTFGDYFKAGKLNLRRNINFEDVFGQNEDKTGKEYNSANFKNAYDALEAKAAVFEYFTKIAKERNIPEEDIDAYVNAMYNMGPYHNDLNNMDYVRRTYSITPYFKLGGILKAQDGTGNLYAPHPLSPIDIALNQAKAMAKMKGEQPKQPQQQYLPPGVKEVVGPDGKKVAIRTEQPLVPLEQSIAEWLPGTGDVAEVGYIANDVKNGNYGSAALATAMVALPGNVGKVFRKSDIPTSKLTETERLGIPKGERNQPAKAPTKNQTYKKTVNLESDEDYLEDIEAIQQGFLGKTFLDSEHEALLDWFNSPQYKERLVKQGFSEEQINNLLSNIKDKLSRKNLKYAVDLNSVRQWGIGPGMALEIDPQLYPAYEAMTNGNIKIGGQPINWSLIQLKKGVDLDEMVPHEVGGHHLESLVAEFNAPYTSQQITDMGKKATISSGLPEGYYPSWWETRARALTIAKQMREAGWNPNSPEQVNMWLNKHLLKDHKTNVVQGALYYDRPGFVKAVSEGLKNGGKL